MIVITVRPLCEAIAASCVSTLSGNTARNSCPRNFCIATGAGISNDTGGTLTISKSTVSCNHVTVSCPSTASCTTGGGGVDKVDSTLRVSNSTTSGNVSLAGSRIVASVGGGIAKRGTLSVNNSTIAGNAAGAGGGIYNFSSPAATIQNSIVANNLGGNCHGTPTWWLGEIAQGPTVSS